MKKTNKSNNSLKTDLRANDAPASGLSSTLDCKEESAEATMRKIFAACIILAILMSSWDYGFSEDSSTTNAEAMLKLAPRISLEEKNVSTFEVKGILTANGIQLRFIVSGKKPDQLTLKLLDPRDGTPIMVGAGNSFMMYDPVSSEVLLGRAVPVFTLSAKESDKTDPDNYNLVMSFGYRSVRDEKKEGEDKEEMPSTTVVDIHSLIASLIQPFEVKTKDGKRFVVEGKTKRGGRLVAYVIPLRKEGPYTRLELYKADIAGDQPFLVLDDIVLNQQLPEGHFSLPEKKLLASALPTKQMTTDNALTTIFSLGRFFRTIMARLVLAGVDDPTFRSTVEKMSMRKLDWQKLEKEDKKATTILKSIFGDDVVQDGKTIQQAGTTDR